MLIKVHTANGVPLFVNTLAVRFIEPCNETSPAADEPAPEGMPADVWAALPANLRDVINRATMNGAKLQVVNLSDIMADESVTKH